VPVDGEELLRRSQDAHDLFACDLVEGLPTVRMVGHETAVLQAREVPGDVALRSPNFPNEIDHALFTFQQSEKDGQAGLV